MNSATTSDPTVLSAARWFWWIAGLSLVNTVLFYSGSNTSFVIGLGMTALAGIFFANSIVLAAISIGLILGFYVLMGLKAQQEKAWAFYLGLALYVVDALIYVYFQSWMSVAFHAFAIYCIVQGLLKLRELAAAPAAPVEPEAAP
jgi:hypothetical protein